MTEIHRLILARKARNAAYGRNQKIFSHYVTRRDTKKEAVSKPSQWKIFGSPQGAGSPGQLEVV